MGPICSATLIEAAAEEILIRNDADPEIKNTARSSTNLFKNEADPVNISAIKEELRDSLLSIASKLFFFLVFKDFINTRTYYKNYIYNEVYCQKG